MIRESHTAIVARNEPWSGAVATEPYECGWAGEAIIFVRALEVSGTPAPVQARVQISPDGMRWVDEGSHFTLPAAPDAIGFVRVREFGNWLRLAAELPDGFTIKALVTLSLKG